MIARKAARAALLAASVLGALSGVHLRAQDLSEEELQALFASPPKSARPMIRWWWPGGDVEDSVIRSEIAAFDAAGFGGVEVQPFDEGMSPPTAAQQKRIDDFATPDFFAHIAVAAQAAREHGSFLDYTFGSGWPSGGAFVTPEHASLELRSTVRSVTGPASGIRLDIPARGGFYGAGPAREGPSLPEGWAERIAAREKIIAVIAWPGSAPHIEHTKGSFGQPITTTTAPGILTAKPVDLTDRLRADGTLDWTAPKGEWQIFVYRQLPTLQRVTGGVGGGAQLVLDHFDRAAFDAYASHILPEALPGAADGLRAVFVDSLEVRVANWWSEDFLAQFQKRHGYDLRLYLPFIEQVGWPSPFDNTVNYEDPGIAEKVRADYRQTVRDLIRERFFEPFEEAVHARGLKTRLQAHGAPGDLLTLYGQADIPETEDLFEGVSPSFLKMASSAAHIYGKPVTAAEAFIIPGTDGYGTTPRQVKERADALLVNGANALIAHGAPYPYHTDLRPYGWYPWGGVFSSMLGTRNPLLPYFAPVNRYVARLQAVFQNTVTIAPVAVFRESGPYPDARPGGGPADTPEPEANSTLRHAGYDWDHIDTTALDRSDIAEGAIRTPGTGRYRVLVVPHPSKLTKTDMAALTRALGGGVPVLLISDSEKASTRDAVEDLARAGAQWLAGPEELPAALLASGVAPQVDFAGSDPLPFLVKALPGKGRLLFVTNPHDAPREARILVPAGQRVEQWDAWSGSVRPAETYEEGERQFYNLRLEAGQSRLLALVPPAHAISSGPPSQAEERAPSTLARLRTWDVRLDGIDEDGRTVRHEATGAPLADWSAWAGGKAVSGNAHYSTRFTLSASAQPADLVLDLGDVGEAARVTVNGCAIIAPYAPYTVSLSGLVHPGSNTVQIDVANSPLNATRNDPGGIGAGPHKPAPRPAGLLGPVQLQTGGTSRWLPAPTCTRP